MTLSRINAMKVASSLGFEHLSHHTPSSQPKPASINKHHFLPAEFWAGIEQRIHKKFYHWPTLAPEFAQPSITELTCILDCLSQQVTQVASGHEPFIVTGGDHSCAMGTWTGAMRALGENQQLGLIWLDAHMDSHTFATTPSGHVHGMPLAALLGAADTELASIYPNGQFLRPEHVILLGVRSYEPEEQALLSRLGVKVVYMNDIYNAQDFSNLLQTTIAELSNHCTHLGVSIDLDVTDPADAPAVATPEPEGIAGSTLCHALRGLRANPYLPLVGVEIVEYYPAMDIDDKTLKLMSDIIVAIYQ